MLTLMMTLLLAATPSTDCTFDVPLEFTVGGEAWCKIGVFQHVKLEIDEEWTEAGLDLHLNETGAQMLIDNTEMFTMEFAGIIEKFAQNGVDTVVDFYFEDEQVMHCYADFDVGETVCESDD